MRGGGYTREVLEIGERVGRGELGVDTSDGILDDDDDEADHLYRLSGDIIRYSGGLQPSYPYRGVSVGIEVEMIILRMLTLMMLRKDIDDEEVDDGDDNRPFKSGR